MNIISSRANQAISENIAKLVNGKVVARTVKNFPDVELYVKLEERLPADEPAVVIGSTPDAESIIELALLTDAVSREGVKKIIVVAPYLGYARQDRVFTQGEALSSEVIAKMLSAKANHFVIVDPHNERIRNYFACSVSILNATNTIANKFRGSVDIVFSPDSGGKERAMQAASKLYLPYSSMNKKRISSFEVEMTLGDADVKDKRVLLVDDIISTGGTIIKAAELLKKAGAKEIHAVCTHGQFLNGSGEKISAVVNSLNATDSIPSKYSSISLAYDIAKELVQIIHKWQA